MFSRRRAAIVFVLGIAAAAQLGAQPERFTRQEADRFQGKLLRIVEVGNRPSARAARQQVTQLTDAEVTAFLRHHARDQVPVGIVDPTLIALGEGRVGGRAVVDLDAVRAQKQRGWLDPLSYMTGKLPLSATGRLVTQAGVGRFQLESAEISGVAVPKTLLQELLTYYSRTPDDPDGINMDDPFELPSRIREIRVGKGEATVIQ
jgi:hypothetical protein